MTKTNYTIEAQHLIDHGISVGPLKTDGKKLPAIKWKEFQNRFMTPEEVQQYFSNCGGIFAITGSLSKLFLLDFDLKYDHPDENTYAKFMSLVPESLKVKMSINKTRSGGMHIWIRTNYTDRSRKITRRDLSIEEFNKKVEDLISNGANKKTAMRIALKVPFEVTLETRGEASYGVITHPSYTPVQKSNGQMMTEQEVEFLLCIGYGLDCGFQQKEKVFVGETDVYKEIVQFNEDCGVEGMVKLIEKSGLYHSVGADYNGNIMMRRTGSDSNHSGYVYQDTGIFKIFGTNLFDTGKDTMNPFEVYKFITGMNTGEAVNKIIEKRKSK